TLGAPPADPDAAPLPDPDLAPLAARDGPPVRAVSYSALSLYERCGYRFYAERVLGLRPRLPRTSRAGTAEPGAVEVDEIHPASEDDERVAMRYGRGRVTHELLERSARAGWTVPAEREAADLLRREGLSPDARQVARVVALVEGFLRARIREELSTARSLHPEAPFALRAGGLLVRGEIDLLADLGDETLVLDYKSDALAGSAPADHMGRYEVQRRIYALAALRRYGRPVRVAYVFLERPEEPVERRFGEHEAAGITDEVAGLAGAVAAGRFTVTESPERSLCLDCPARERLCVHGPELTLRDAAMA
ncbi:MAG: PD-(D/E)XK nuclease family protein, partial [Thermoleophilaceae bacterium]|nr:PD-(D/E)XK nuclease family protein [Thermoleophilaceae bacterium]